MARYFSGERLRATRTAAGISSHTLGQLIGRTLWSVQAYESNRARPSLNVAARIAEVLECPLDDLLADEEPAGAAR